MKRVLSLMLAIFLLTAALPMTVLAADSDLAAASSEAQNAPTGADTLIDEVYITNNVQPVAGATPNYNDIIPTSEQSKYIYAGSTWRNMTDNTVLGSSSTFRSDKIYSLEVIMKANDGYVFDAEDNIGAHIAGTSTMPNYVVQNTGVKELYHKRIFVYFIFRMSVSADTACIIKYYPNGGYGYMKPDVVVYNTTYQLPDNPFTAPYGGTFEKWRYSYASSGTSISTGGPGKRFKVYQDMNVKANWTMSPMIDTVSVTGLASPRWKTSPDYVVTVTGANCMMNTAYDNGTYIVNGVEWREFSNTRVPRNRGFSNSDTRFYVTFYLKTTGSYIFNEFDQMTALVNGRKANIEKDANAADPDSGKYLKVTFGFLSITSYVNVTIPEPVAYQKLASSVTVYGAQQNKSKNTSSYHNGICWTDETNYPGVILPADSIALPGHKYQAVVSIQPSSNYEFPVDSNLHTYLPEAVCNGETLYQNAGYGDYTGDGIRGEDECYVYHLFSTPVEDTYTVLTKAKVSVTAPSVGQSPVYQATAAASGYTVKRIEWINIATGATVTTAQKFEAGGKYTVKVTLKADDGYRFNYSGSAYTTSVYVNGILGYSDPFTNVFEITACYDYSALPSPYYTLSGDYTSYLGADDPVTLELYKDGTLGIKTNKFTQTGAYSYNNLTAGSYTLRVIKKNHVTRDYAITLTGSKTLDVKICPLGDISGDGKVTTKDYAMANAHAQKVTLLSGYALQCGDVLKGDGKITTADAARINAAAQKVDPLW